MTFSIVARCPETGEFGVAAATAMPAVGSLLQHADSGIGAIASQARVNPYLGIDGLALLREGLSASEVLERLEKTDPRFDLRQVAIVDAQGRTAAWTGDGCPKWAGDYQGEGFSVQGNRVDGLDVLEAAADAFMRLSNRPLIERLIQALVAGDAFGGDREGEDSASAYVVGKETYPLWDIRVDYDEDPIAELQRHYEIFRRDLYPHIVKMPTRENPAGEHGEDPV
ncbi:DUF1028 domain-containing protein [Arsenicitalea aurantiaca]|uniref:DUF1028 domain-containing protein n=1 Tax=Arsenicitalea aurantiaca TaxID=1783274 RepID=A0A433X3G6_9HYPH|nr:DUF1028 domain-containing protein [Arsenicitalea aurantiaca]RUT28602.1 DUF1028 domain-containing protein [Arsenicitalea aurantiaca]